MTLDELGALMRQHRLIFLSIAPAPGGGWQASSRVESSTGYATYVTKDDETLGYAVSRVVPGLFMLAEPAPTDEGDVFG